jgi:tetratricopeptide (TPR) repeat protein
MQSGWLRLFTKELSDKWQIPIFVLSIVLAGSVAYQILSSREQSNTADGVQLCETLLNNKQYTQMGQLAVKMLQESQLTDEQREKINLLLARMIYETEKPLQKHDPKRLEAFHRYMNDGVKDRPLTSEEHSMMVDISCWENHYQNAVEHLQVLLDTEAPNRSALLKRKLELLPRTGHDVQVEYNETIDALLSEPNLTDHDLVWALDIKTESLFKAGEYQKAVDLISRVLPRIKDTNSQLQIQYSLALGEYSQGNLDMAEPTLRTILDRIDSRDELDAKVSLLLGNICLMDDRPEEAISFLKSLETNHPQTEYQVCALVKIGRAQAILEHFKDSKSSLILARNLLKEIGPNKLISMDDIQSEIEKIAEYLYAKNNFQEAVAYSDLQSTCIDPDDSRNQQAMLAKLGVWHQKAAEAKSEQLLRVRDPKYAASLKKQMILHYEKAADAYYNLSKTPGLLNRNSAQVLWQAATLYEKAENPEKSQTILEHFVEQWPNDPLLPEGLYRLARIYQQKNNLIPAEKYYLRLIHEFSRTPVGLKARVCLAESYFAMGPDHYQQAETLLKNMVDDSSQQELLTPESLEFRKAMFLLGKLYYHEGNFEHCVARLEEALERDPQNAAVPEARFLIAQSYRKIADELSKKITQIRDRVLKATLTRNWQENLNRSCDLYRQAISVLENIPHRTSLDENYLQLSYIYYADCLYDLGRYHEAVKAYENVIDHYEQSQVALASYVQIANAYQRLGQFGKIKAVLERMKWLMKQLPENSFAGPGEPFSRQDWQDWIEWNYRSGMLGSTTDFPAQNPKQETAF